MQIHRFMEYLKASCLDLQFILLPTATEAKDIQKTFIFINSTTDIFLMVAISQEWMKMKQFPAKCTEWIKPYFATMSDYDKAMTADEFCVPGNQNNKCTIVVATHAYGMGIDNPDVALVIQWNFSCSFDTMIQRMGQARQKKGLQPLCFLV